MKKFIILFVMLFSILLCSCNSESQANPISNNENSLAQLDSYHLRMVTSSWGAQEWCGTEDGFYYLNRINQNAYNISYIDYSSCVMTLLCPSPGCMHVDDTCPAYFQVPNCGASIFTNEDYLYIMTFSDGSAERNNEFPRLYRLNKDGSDRKLLMELSQGERFSRYVAADESALYVHIVSAELNSKGLSDVCIVRKVDIDKGTVDTVVNLSANAQLCGAYNDSLVFQSVYIPDDLGESDFKDIKNSLYEISLSSKEQTAISDWSNGESAFIIDEEKIFSLNYRDSTINEQVISDKKAKSLICHIPDDIIYDLCIFDYADSRVLVFDLIEYGNPQARRFAVFLQNNQLYEITLNYSNGEITFPYTVFSNVADGLLIQCGVQQFNQQGVFSNGEMDSFVYTEPLFGIIKVFDYLNNEDNIQMINRVI